MATLHHNITGELTQQLLAVGAGVKVKSISLTNIHATNACKVDLHIASCSGKYYLLKSVDLPIGATLIHDTISFSNNTDQFGLFIKLTKSASETPAVDVIIM